MKVGRLAHLTLLFMLVAGKTAVFFETEAIIVPGLAPQTELVFDKIGDTYFLSKVFVKGDDGGNLLPKSKMQRRLEEGGSRAESHSITVSTTLAKSSKRPVR